MRRPPDQGSASLWLLVVGLLLVAAGTFVAAVGAATVARHRAGTAADLGALAGARWALWGPDTACPEAAAIVTANGGRMTACRVVGADVIVSVEVPLTSLPALRAAVGAARAEARAGPVRADAATASGSAAPIPPALFVLRRPGSPETNVEAFAGPAPLGTGVEVVGRHAMRPKPMVRCPEGGTPGHVRSAREDDRAGRLREVRMELSLATRTVAGHTVLDVGGEVDVYTAPRLRERLVELVDGGARKVVVDLDRVDFLDSTGLGVLVGALKRLRAAGGTFGLVCAKEPLLKIFRITALDQVFPLYDTVEAATGADAGPAA